MPAVTFGAPEPGTYQFALVRRDWNPRTEVRERNATSVCRSRCVAWPKDLDLPSMPGQYPGRTGEVMMMFVTNRHLASRLTKLGWRDITTEWAAFAETHDAKPIENSDARFWDRLPEPEVVDLKTLKTVKPKPAEAKKTTAKRASGR